MFFESFRIFVSIFILLFVKNRCSRHLFLIQASKQTQHLQRQSRNLLCYVSYLMCGAPPCSRVTPIYMFGKEKSLNIYFLEIYFNFQVILQHAESEVRLAQDPFPLHPGEEVEVPTKRLTVVQDGLAITLKVLRNFTDEITKEERQAGRRLQCTTEPCAEPFGFVGSVKVERFGSAA